MSLSSACGLRGDIVFVLDASSSVSKEDYNKGKAFIKELMSSFSISDDLIRVGLVAFNQFVHIAFHLNKISEPGQTATSLRNLVDNATDIQVGTFTHKALQAVREEMFLPDKGDRPDVPNIVIVLTDGRSRKPEETVKEAAMLRENGTLMFAIAVGQWRSDTELQVLASKPAPQYKFTVETFDGLETIRSSLSEKTCKGLCEVLNLYFLNKQIKNVLVCIECINKGSVDKKFNLTQFHLAGAGKYGRCGVKPQFDALFGIV